MQRFELIEGKSSKFWEVDVSGALLTVRYGRIGTNGQTQTKTFDDEAAAIKERDKLIKAKTGKGYAEVGVAAGAALAAVAPKAPAAPKAKAAETAEAEPPAPPSLAAVAAQVPQGSLTAADLPWPKGEVNQKLLDKGLNVVVRGIHCPPAPITLADLSKAISKKDGSSFYYWSHRCRMDLASVARALGKNWQPWGKRELTRAELESPDPDFWLEALAQAFCGMRMFFANTDAEVCVFLIHIGSQLHGPAFMLERFLTLAQVDAPNVLAYDSACHAMRHVIALADDEAYAAALAVAEGTRALALDTADAARRKSLLSLLATLFRHLQPWVDDALALLEKNDEWWRGCVMSVEQAREAFRRSGGRPWYAFDCAQLQIHLHGEQAMPLLQDILAKCEDSWDVEKTLAFIKAVPCPGQITVLLANMEGRKEIRQLLDSLAARYPAATLYAAITQLHGAARRSSLLSGWTLRLAANHPAELAQALAALPPEVSAAFRAELQALDVPEAPPEALPALLQSPPWLAARRQKALPVLDMPAPHVEPGIEWTAEQTEKLRATKPDNWLVQRIMGRVEKNKQANLGRLILTELGIMADARDAVLAGGPIRSEDFDHRNLHDADMGSLLLLTDEQALNIWNQYPSQRWDMWYCRKYVRPLLARLGVAALPGFEALCASYPLDGLQLAEGLHSLGIALVAARALLLKKAKPHGQKWLKAHPRTAAIAALQLAFGKDKAGRDAGAACARWLIAQGHEAALDAAAEEYGGDMPAALAALKALDPLSVLPARMPNLPAFFSPAAFARPLLADGRALPVQAINHIGTMLQISTLDDPYAGLDIVRQACRADSLAAFAWDLFEAWQVAGYPSKESWVFAAQGLLGNDETVRRLAPRIRAWPGEGGHARAVTGLDVLTAIGTDLALTNLNAMAEKLKFKGLQEKARAKIAAIAEARDLTPADLADRLVPTLGLDAGSTLALDFGPRQFTVAFDENLKPFVRDAQGARLKDLPKPVKADDAEKAAAATTRYKQLKKDAKAIATIQITRLELAMCQQRRWSAADFRAFFIGHPVMRFLAARLVWGVYENGQLQTPFRVAEDFSLADANDDAWELPETLPEGAAIGIVHVLQMPADLQAAFGQIFADYEIMQPFRQLGRETYALTPEEIKARVITRFAERKVATGSVMGLINRGWERGEAMDAGWVGEFTKTTPAGDIVVANLDPGTCVGYIDDEPVQRITEIYLEPAAHRSWNRDPNHRCSLDTLDAITISEVLRDIDLMPPAPPK